jgi:hypothetical protein
MDDTMYLQFYLLLISCLPWFEYWFYEAKDFTSKNLETPSPSCWSEDLSWQYCIYIESK